MHQDVNSFICTGKLADKPETRTTRSGSVFVKLRIESIGRRWNGDEYEPKPNYVPITVWREDPRDLCASLKEGSHVTIQARVSTRQVDGQYGSYDIVDIIADSIIAGEPPAQPTQQKRRRRAKAKASEQPDLSTPTPDDDIPF